MNWIQDKNPILSLTLMSLKWMNQDKWDHNIDLHSKSLTKNTDTTSGTVVEFSHPDWYQTKVKHVDSANMAKHTMQRCRRLNFQDNNASSTLSRTFVKF